MQVPFQPDGIGSIPLSEKLSDSGHIPVSNKPITTFDEEEEEPENVLSILT
jgi:hypothetical protein